MDQGKRNKFLCIIAGCTGTVILFLLVWGALVEPNMLTVRRESFAISGLPPELDGMTAVIVADTHFGNTFLDRMRMNRIIRYVKREKPWTVWLLGDYIGVGSVHGYGAPADEKLERFFKEMKAPMGTFAVLGNHELWYGRKRMVSIMERAGVIMIEKKTADLGGITIAGVPDGSTTVFDRKSFNKMLERKDPLILLSHKGNMLKSISCKYNGFMAAADTHGGQVRLPGVGSLAALAKKEKELPPGFSRRWGKNLFITTGAGGHRLGFRFMCPPEIAVLTLKKGAGRI
ncbi:MAG: metallophosphoesterase [Lentisphaeria bacterium]|nr:metallophosphoesterase [Lentisphaeria bacterium]